jgi:hypothetical protein
MLSPSSATGAILDPGLCAPDQNRFTLRIDNPYFPLPVGQRWVLLGEEEGELTGLRITVLDQTASFYGGAVRRGSLRSSTGWTRTEMVASIDGRSSSRPRRITSPRRKTAPFAISGRKSTSTRAVSWSAMRAHGGPTHPEMLPASSCLPNQNRAWSSSRKSHPASRWTARRSSAEPASVCPPGRSTTRSACGMSTCSMEVWTTSHYARGVGLVIDGPLQLLRYRQESD